MGTPAQALPGVALRRRDQDFVDGVWDVFASLRLTIPLLFLLAAACTLGTFANPENHSLAEIQKAIGAAWWFPVYLFFELNDLFHSWWFVLLLVLLFLNLSACTIERLPRIFKIALRPDKWLSERLLRGVKHSARLPFPASGSGERPDARRAAAVAVALLRARGFEPEVFEGAAGSPGNPSGSPGNPGDVYIFTERGRFSRFGVWIVHLSLFMILTGALLGRILGKEGIINVPMDGGQFSYIFRKTAAGSPFRQPLSFSVRVDDFRLLKYLNGNPRSFESDLVVLDSGREILKKTIKVGDPLEYGGWTIYQASYQADSEKDQIKLGVTQLATGAHRDYRLQREGEAETPDGVRFAVKGFTSNFSGLGPAVQVQRTEGAGPDAKQTTFWVFQRYPEFDALNRGDRYGLRFDGLVPFFFTGLQVARDPGYLLWLVGCCILFVGLAIAFYTSHRRIWVRASGDGELVLAGVAHKNQAAFEQFFQDLVRALSAGSPSGSAPA